MEKPHVRPRYLSDVWYLCHMKSEAAVLSIQSVVQYREVDDDVAYVQDVDNKVRLTRKRPRLMTAITVVERGDRIRGSC